MLKVSANIAYHLLDSIPGAFAFFSSDVICVIVTLPAKNAAAFTSERSSRAGTQRQSLGAFSRYGLSHLANTPLKPANMKVYELLSSVKVHKNSK